MDRLRVAEQSLNVARRDLRQSRAEFHSAVFGARRRRQRTATGRRAAVVQSESGLLARRSATVLYLQPRRPSRRVRGDVVVLRPAAGQAAAAVDRPGRHLDLGIGGWAAPGLRGLHGALQRLVDTHSRRRSRNNGRFHAGHAREPGDRIDAREPRWPLARVRLRSARQREYLPHVTLGWGGRSGAAHHEQRRRVRARSLARRTLRRVSLLANGNARYRSETPERRPGRVRHAYSGARGVSGVVTRRPGARVHRHGPSGTRVCDAAGARWQLDFPCHARQSRAGPRVVAGFARWSPNGRTLYFKAHDVRGAPSFWSVSPQGGRARLLVRFDDPPWQSSRNDFTTDGKRLYFA